MTPAFVHFAAPFFPIIIFVFILEPTRANGHTSTGICTTDAATGTAVGAMSIEFSRYYLHGYREKEELTKRPV